MTPAGYPALFYLNQSEHGRKEGRRFHEFISEFPGSRWQGLWISKILLEIQSWRAVTPTGYPSFILEFDQTYWGVGGVFASGFPCFRWKGIYPLVSRQLSSSIGIPRVRPLRTGLNYWEIAAREMDPIHPTLWLESGAEAGGSRSCLPYTWSIYQSCLLNPYLDCPPALSDLTCVCVYIYIILLYLCLVYLIEIIYQSDHVYHICLSCIICMYMYLWSICMRTMCVVWLSVLYIYISNLIHHACLSCLINLILPVLDGQSVLSPLSCTS